MLRGRRRLGGQADDEARASLRRELGMKAPAVQLDDLPADMQAQADAGDLAVGMGLVEAIEDVGAVLPGHPQSPVRNDDADGPVPSVRELDVDRPAVRAVFDGV